MSQFKYLGTIITNTKSIQKEIKGRLNSGNACYYSTQNVLLSKTRTFRIYKIIILPVVLYRCENLSLILRDEYSLRVFENSVLRWIFGPKRVEVTGGWRNYITRSFVICALHQV
jgi:hypothetical protein